MDDNKIIAIEFSSKIIDKVLTYKENFTTNKNYLGHIWENNELVPAYYNRLLKKGEIRKIMSNEEIKVLPEGKYQAKVEQVIRKHGKDANGNEDINKDIISVELNVKGHNDKFYYVTFCVKGYSDKQMEIAKEQLQELCDTFKIAVIEELAGKVVTLVAKKNANGYTNYYINEKKEFFDWNSFEGFKFTNEIEFPCTVTKFYKKDNKIVFNVVAKVGDKEVNEFVVYDLNLDFKVKAFANAMKRMELTEDYLDVMISKPSLLVVKKTVKGDKTYFNKRLGFPKIEPRKPQKW